MQARFAAVRTDTDRAMDLAATVEAVTTELRDADGVVAAKRFFATPFTDEIVEPVLGLFVVTAWSDDAEALEKAWANATPALFHAPSVLESFELLAEPARADGDGWGFAVPTDDVPRLESSEPMVAIISGRLFPEYEEPFNTAALSVVRQAHGDPSYLGGCGMTETLSETISFSFWRSAGAARRFAFGAGAHMDAKEADEAGGWHDQATNFFVALRPLAASGSLLGANPLDGLALGRR